ncbi:MAG: metallophosphoesterase, partial [Chitinophagaceae bacterium]
QAVKTVSQSASYRWRLTIQITYWVITVTTLVSLLALPYVQTLQTNKLFRNYIFAILAGLFISKLVASLFLGVDDIRRLFMWGYQKIAQQTGGQDIAPTNGISRSAFISWLGIGIGSTLFGTLLYGFSNKYKYQLVKLKVPFKNLPQSFKGLKIIHISDIHSGSLQNKEAVNKGIDLILAQKPDIILFTGDLVNDRHEEMLAYQSVFSRLKATYGVFSTLGNHDYGDYVMWPTAEAKAENLEKLKQIHANMGWKLLMNEHVTIDRNGEKIALIGIENWGAKGRFPKYGKLDVAHAGTKNIPFKILMSHDPSHWDAQVIPQYPDIDLMLAGHTHGMQFGLENPYFKWSPVQWMYKQWAGLYENNNQKLYVNRGFGFIGYPGRVGILPEITLLELETT